MEFYHHLLTRLHLRGSIFMHMRNFEFCPQPTNGTESDYVFLRGPKCIPDGRNIFSPQEML